MSAIFRPCVTSSGRTRRKSKTQGSVAGSDPRAVTMSVRTSFHSVICIARFARQTHSVNRIGLGPAWKTVRFLIIEARSSGSCSRGIWWRSYTIWLCQRRKHPHMSSRRTLPFSVVAAKSFAAASTELDSSIANVVVHASCYNPSRQPCLPLSSTMPNIPTSETSPRTRVPALSVYGSIPTA